MPWRLENDGGFELLSMRTYRSLYEKAKELRQELTQEGECNDRHAFI